MLSRWRCEPADPLSASIVTSRRCTGDLGYAALRGQVGSTRARSAINTAAFMLEWHLFGGSRRRASLAALSFIGQAWPRDASYQSGATLVISHDSTASRSLGACPAR
jgi:hypothetical protein